MVGPVTDLAGQQAALVRALVAGGPVPDGFDAAELAMTARALLRKRAQEVARRFPMLAHECGPNYQDLYCAWAKDRPKISTLSDARAFAEHVGIGPQRKPRARWFRRWRIGSGV